MRSKTAIPRAHVKNIRLNRRKDSKIYRVPRVKSNEIFPGGKINSIAEESSISWEKMHDFWDFSY